MQSCIKEKDTLIEKPIVEVISPLPCDTLYFGEEFWFELKLKDNSGLGNVKMDVHNNFGHHRHGEHEACNMDEIKDAITPYFSEWILGLPSEKLEYILDTLLQIPDTLDFDTGDYHFHMYVTDDEGYQSFTTMDVKILNR